MEDEKCWICITHGDIYIYIKFGVGKSHRKKPAGTSKNTST